MKVARGFRFKPAWINYTASFLLLAPILIFVVALAVMGVQQWYNPAVWSEAIPMLGARAWMLMSATYLCGLLLLVVRRWALTAGILILALITLYNVVTFKDYAAASTFVAILVVSTPIALIAGLLLSPFRKPYLNPRLRWWESEARYRVDLPVKLGEARPLLADISLTGLLVQWKSEEEVPLLSGESEVELPEGLKLPCLVVRRVGLGYGLQFKGLSAAQKKGLRDFVRELAKDPGRYLR